MMWMGMRRSAAALTLVVAVGLTAGRQRTVERDALVRAMQLSQGNKSKAAQMLGVSRKRLYRMLYEYGLAKSPSGEEI